MLRSESFGEGTATRQQNLETTSTRLKLPTRGNNTQYLKFGIALRNVYRLKNIIIKDRGYGARTEGKEKMNERTVPILATINSAEL